LPNPSNGRLPGRLQAPAAGHNLSRTHPGSSKSWPDHRSGWPIGIIGRDFLLHLGNSGNLVRTVTQIGGLAGSGQLIEPRFQSPARGFREVGKFAGSHSTLSPLYHSIAQLNQLIAHELDPRDRSRYKLRQRHPPIHPPITTHKHSHPCLSTQVRPSSACSHSHKLKTGFVKAPTVYSLRSILFSPL